MSSTLDPTAGDGTTDGVTDGVSKADSNEARERLLYGLGLGFLAYLLAWHEGPAATGFLVWVVVLASVVCSLVWRRRTVNTAFVMGWSMAACLAAAVMVLRYSTFLNLAMMAVLWIASAMITLQLCGCHLQQFGIVDVLRAKVRTAGACLYGIIPVVSTARLQELTRHHQAYRVLRGSLILLPLLILFLGLFASADAIFSLYTSRALSWVSEEMIGHLIRLLLFTWISTGLFTLLVDTGARQRQYSGFTLRLGPLETHIVLGGLCGLFIIFVLVQLSYLFGGRDLIVSSWEMTIADYARRGFFELLAVAGLSITMLLFMVPDEQSRNHFRHYALAIIACVLVMQASAMQRLVIYISEFGLTFDRVIACAVLLWLCIVLLLLARANLRQHYRGFIHAGIASGVAVLLTCALLNPAALVARVNLNREEGVDINYLLQLGPDAVPPLMDRFEQLPVPAQCWIAGHFGQWQTPTADHDWRNFNLALWRARQSIREHEPLIAKAVAALVPPRDCLTVQMLGSGDTPVVVVPSGSRLLPR